MFPEYTKARWGPLRPSEALQASQGDAQMYEPTYGEKKITPFEHEAGPFKPEVHFVSTSNPFELELG